MTRAPAALAVPAHAKLNLSLAVLGVRDNGYHEIRSRFQAISLHDLLLVEPAGATTLEVLPSRPAGEAAPTEAGGGAGTASPDTVEHRGGPDDLVLRAQRALEAAVGRPLPARFRLVKRIPPGAGLGGGSADAVAALRGLRAVHRLDCDLRPVAAALGADVPFFLAGGAAVATGLGERLQAAPAAGGWFAIAWPGFPLSTAAVYRRWDDVGGEGENQLTRAALAVEPKLAEFASMLGEGWRMTGSGSAFFAACASRAEAEGRIAGLTCWTAVATPVAAWEDHS